MAVHRYRVLNGKSVLSLPDVLYAVSVKNHMCFESALGLPSPVLHQSGSAGPRLSCGSGNFHFPVSAVVAVTF